MVMPVGIQKTCVDSVALLKSIAASRESDVSLQVTTDKVSDIVTMENVKKLYKLKTNVTI
jgi:SpoVK/Ycf46/Vps4 family AAA+-type ATPase